MIVEKAIVLKKFPYKNGFIVEVFTEQNGKCSFIVHSRKNKKLPVQQIESLTLIECEYLWTEKSSLQQFKHFRVVNHQDNLLFIDPIKNCIRIFFAEFLKNLLLANSSNQSVFEFFEQIINFIQLQNSEQMNNLPCFVLQKMTKTMGVHLNYLSINHLGVYNNSLIISDEATTYLIKIEKGTIFDAEDIKVSPKARSEALEFLCLYFRSQFEHFNDLKSLAIVKQILE
jgi:hypothetical protein